MHNKSIKQTTLRVCMRPWLALSLSLLCKEMAMIQDIDYRYTTKIHHTSCMYNILVYIYDNNNTNNNENNIYIYKYSTTTLYSFLGFNLMAAYVLLVSRLLFWLLHRPTHAGAGQMHPTKQTVYGFMSDHITIYVIQLYM